LLKERLNFIEYLINHYGKDKYLEMVKNGEIEKLTNEIHYKKVLEKAKNLLWRL